MITSNETYGNSLNCNRTGRGDHNVTIFFGFKAVMEEADIGSAEIKKASYEFERDVVKGAVNQVLHLCVCLLELEKA